MSEEPFPMRHSPEVADTSAPRTTRGVPAGKETSPQAASAGGGAAPVAFGRYLLKRLLGEGAMGSVYLARDTMLGRPVALKIPKFAANDTEGRARFLREAELAGSLQHSNLCPIYEVGQIEGRLYLSMAFLEGRTLDTYVSPEAPMPPQQAAPIIRKLALALAAAHAAGVVHRDLKPENIMIDTKGEPIVMDFGLARTAADGGSGRITQSGIILGSPAYMAPEQAHDNPSHIGPWSDVYSLGVVLFELITGRVPFEGSVIAVLSALASKDVPSPREIRADVDESLAAICQRMTAKRPHDRYGSMLEAADALDAYLRGEPPEHVAPAHVAPEFDEAETAAETERVAAASFQTWSPFTPAPSSEPVDRPPATSAPDRRQTVVTGRARDVRDRQAANSKATGAGAESDRWLKAIALGVGAMVGIIVLGVVLSNRQKQETEPDAAAAAASAPAIVEKSVAGASQPTESPAKERRNAPNDERPKAPANPAPANPTPNPAVAAPDPAGPLFDAMRPRTAVEARAAQLAWADRLQIGAEIENSIGMKLLLIPPGLFSRGSPDSDKDASPGEKPQHAVHLERPLYLAHHETTQREWRAVMETEPWKAQIFTPEGDDDPATHVSWDDAQEFCRKLSQRDGITYRLPTEAEWEYACRAGARTRFGFGDDDSTLTEYAWFDKNAREVGERYAHPVGHKKPNAFGLIDMHGNVGEWCDDWHDEKDYARQGASVAKDPRGPSSGSLRVVRGGNWHSAPKSCRSASRNAKEPVARDYDLGFRVVVVLPSSVEGAPNWSAVAALRAGLPPFVTGLPNPATPTPSAPPPSAPVRSDEKPTAPINDSPPLFDATSEKSAAEARAAQEIWARHLQTTVETENSIGMKLALIPPGEYLRGSPDSDKDALRDEKPQHRVLISQSFLLSRHEVTQGEWKAVADTEPWKGKQNVKEGKDHPATYVSWDDAQEFCKALGKKMGGQTYRLPTEAEWEYACRAGAAGRYGFGDDESTLGEYAWWGGILGDGNARLEQYAHPAGSKKPNAFGLFDMHGNVLEWCADAYDAGAYEKLSRQFAKDPQALAQNKGRTQCVLRGGSWMDPPKRCSAARRFSYGPQYIGLNGQVGFRVVAVLPPHSVNIPTYPSLEEPKPEAPSESASAGPAPGIGKPVVSGNGQPPLFDATSAKTAAEARAAQAAWATHRQVDVEFENSIGMKFALIPPGDYLRGSPNSDKDAKPDEKPQHKVRISKPFLFGQHETTQGEWTTVMGTEPWKSQRSNMDGEGYPATSMKGDDIVEFYKRLSQREGATYRLPTEAEWEYACRAGTTSRYSFGDDESKLSEYAWWRGSLGDGIVKTEQYAHRVGLKKPNPFGLFDMHGNVLEWCRDGYDEKSYQQFAAKPPPANDPLDPPNRQTLFVLRGGSWIVDSTDVRSAVRKRQSPTVGYFDIGFRLVRELPSGPVKLPKRPQFGAPKPKAAGPQDGVRSGIDSIGQLRLAAGQSANVTLRGSTQGTVWGVDVYTSDSSLAAAAVHAGIVKPGEDRVVTVRLLPGRKSYEGRARNGVVSQAWAEFSSSFEFVRENEPKP